MWDDSNNVKPLDNVTQFVLSLALWRLGGHSGARDITVSSNKETPAELSLRVQAPFLRLLKVSSLTFLMVSNHSQCCYYLNPPNYAKLWLWPWF